MKMKAGTCCTLACRVAGATERTISPARPTSATRLRCQPDPELQDDDPASSPTDAQALPNANSNSMISTGSLACDNEYLMGLEMLYIRGPFSFQAEYGWNWLNNASGILGTSTAAHPALTTPTNYMFNGGYVQVAYTLTGENRAYDKKAGCSVQVLLRQSGTVRKGVPRPG